jgi:hypothetical protein
MSELTTVLVSSLVGGGVAFVGAVLRETFAARRQLDQSLRDERIRLYQLLWQTTGMLPLWPRARISYADLGRLSRELRAWYFDEGGIYLSEQSRARYGELQERVGVVLASQRARPADPVDADDYDGVRQKCSALRTSLTKDLSSRRGRSGVLMV